MELGVGERRKGGPTVSVYSSVLGLGDVEEMGPAREVGEVEV